MKANYLPFLMRLRNIEFPVAYESICTQFEDEEFEAVNVQQSFDAAKSYLSEVKTLKNMRLQHPLTKTISQLTKERHQYLLSLRGRVTYFLRSPIDSERTAAKVLDTWLYGYRDDFTNPSINGQSGIIDNMMSNIKISVPLMQAIEALDLMSTFDILSSTTSEIKHNVKIRLDERKASLLKSWSIKTTAYTKMKTFWKSIELEIELKVVDVEKYANYLNDINWAITDFRSSYLSKTTRKINAALKAEEEKDAENSSSSQNSTPSNRGTGGKLNARTFNNLDLQKSASSTESLPNGEAPDNTTNGSEALPNSKEDPDDATKTDNSTLNDSEKEPDK